MGNQYKESAVAFLEAALAYYGSLGITVERVMTDNGNAIDRKPSARPANASASAKSSPGPIRRKPMARPSASSKRHSGNGPTRAPIRTPINDQRNCPFGSIATTGIASMLA